MKHYRFVVALWLALGVPLGALGQAVGILHINPLHLELPTTWNFDGTKHPIEGRGPTGEKVLISVYRQVQGGSSESIPPPSQAAEGFAHGLMTQLATKGGQVVVRQISDFPLAVGKIGFSAASESSHVFGGKSYFVQYVLASPSALIYFTFEGKGDALSAAQRLDALFTKQTWDD